jgi:hypothetical protein
VKALAGASTAAAALVIATAGAAKDAVPPCATSAPQQGPSGLPAALSLATRCAGFELQRDGSLRLNGRGLVRGDVSRPWISFGDGLSWRLVAGRLTASRGGVRLWRSSRRYSRLLDLQGAAVGTDHVAFVYRSRLFVATGGGPERPITRNEWPLGWSRGQLLFTRGGHDVRLRAADGTFLAVVQRRARAIRFDAATGTVLTVTRDARLERFDGRTTTSLLRLRDVGLPVWTWPEPLAGGLIGLSAKRRVVIVRSDGSLFASASFPAGRRWNAAGNSGLVASASGDAVALTMTEGNTGYRSRGAEWVLVLRKGDRVARLLHREPLRFAVCERWTTLEWRKGWLLYSGTEGHTLAFDTTARRVVDLSAFVARLPGGRPDGQGKVELGARWAT